MKISMDKKYKTRDGEEVRVLCTDRIAPYSVVAIVGTTETIMTFTREGHINIIGNHPTDLIEISEWDDFKIDEPVMVDIDGTQTVERVHFAGISSDGGPCFWDGRRTSWTEKYRVICNSCRRPTEEELNNE